MPDEIIPKPTCLEHVRHFFEEVDVDHMAEYGVDLSTYPAVKANAIDVFTHTMPPDAHMPADPDGAQEIAANVDSCDIEAKITRAMAQPTWEKLTYGIEREAHDTSFDPLFWFFHSNWERLWWEWQQTMGATTLTTFRTTITGSALFLTPPFNQFRPFPQTADQTIDLSQFGVGYADPHGTRETPIVRRAVSGSRTIDQPKRVSDLPWSPSGSRASTGWLTSTSLSSRNGSPGAVLKVDVEVLDRDDPR
jgi:hypothetical protein